MERAFPVESQLKVAGHEETESFLPQPGNPRKHFPPRRHRVVVLFAILNVSALLLIYILLRAEAPASAFPNPFPSSKLPLLVLSIPT